MKEKYTVIVGAGLTGLSAAWKLVSEGHKCLLLEQRSTPGGLASTQLLDDIIFDLGPHFVFPDKHSPGGRLINELVPDSETITREFRYAIITDKHHYKMPIKSDILWYPLKYKKQIIGNILSGSKSNAPHHSLRNFIESKFGIDYYKEVFGGMIKKKTGRDGKDLHVDWYIRPERDFQNDLLDMPPKTAKIKHILQPLKTFFTTNNYRYPKRGFSYITDQLFARYKKAGGETIFDCKPIALQCDRNKVVSCKTQDTVIPVTNLIWTGSNTALSSLLPDTKETILPQLDTLILLLTFNGKRLQQHQYSYTYYSSESIIFNRAYYPDNIYKEHSPKDKEGLCLEINWFKNISSLTDEEIIQKALEDVEQLGIFQKQNIRHSKLIRLKKSLPVYGLDYKEQLTSHNSTIKRYSNLYSVGRSSGYFFCMSPAAVNQGLRTAEHILKVS